MIQIRSSSVIKETRRDEARREVELNKMRYENSGGILILNQVSSMEKTIGLPLVGLFFSSSSSNLVLCLAQQVELRRKKNEKRNKTEKAEKGK